MFSGDIEKLRKVGRSIQALTSVPSRAATPIADGINRLLAKEFRTGKDPYGQNWRKLSKATLGRGRTPPPLTDSGAGRDATKATPKRGAGIVIHIPAHLVYHQFGYVNARGGGYVGARPILPYRGLPSTWKSLIDKEVRKAFKGAQ